MTSVTVSVRGQIALPAEVCRKLGIVGDSRLEVEISSGAVVLRPLRGGKDRVSVSAATRVASGGIDLGVSAACVDCLK